MILSLFYNILSVFLIMIPGYILIRKEIMPDTVLKYLSKVVIMVVYPCLIFDSITNNFTIEGLINSWQLPVASFLITFTGFIVGFILINWLKFNNIKQKKSFLYQCTFNNYSFLPLAIIAKIYAKEYVAALIFSTLGAEVAVWTIGITILSAEKSINIKSSLKNLFSPPLIGIYLATVVLYILFLANNSIDNITTRFILLKYVLDAIKTLGEATVPLSLIIAGARIAKTDWNELKNKMVWVITFFRLIIIPVVAIVILMYIFPSNKWLPVMFIVAVMPVSINSLVLGELYDADQHLISGTVLITHVLALLTIPVWLAYLL